MDGKEKKLSIMALLGGPSESDEHGADGDMAIRALYRASKDSDEDGFVEAFREAVSSCGSYDSDTKDEVE